jgi:hypothetical protein
MDLEHSVLTVEEFQTYRAPNCKRKFQSYFSLTEYKFCGGMPVTIIGDLQQLHGHFVYDCESCAKKTYQFDVSSTVY